MELIDKVAVMAEIEKRIKKYATIDVGNSSKLDASFGAICYALKSILTFIDTLEVKEIKDNSLEKFKSLQHISGDLKSTLQDGGYTPSLYYFDGSWHVDWIACEEGDSIKYITTDTAEEAINEAYNWFHSTFCNG